FEDKAPEAWGGRNDHRHGRLRAEEEAKRGDRQRRAGYRGPDQQASPRGALLEQGGQVIDEAQRWPAGPWCDDSRSGRSRMTAAASVVAARIAAAATTVSGADSCQASASDGDPPTQAATPAMDAKARVSAVCTAEGGAERSPRQPQDVRPGCRRCHSTTAANSR